MHVMAMFWLTRWVLVFLVGAAGLLVLAPDSVMINGGLPTRPAFVHLLVLGGLLGWAHVFFLGKYPVFYGPNRWHGRVVPWVVGFHVLGVLTMVYGLASADSLWVYIGAHYLVPFGIVITLLLGWWMAWKREEGRPLALWLHLPGLGLLAAMSLGALMAMDMHRGLYGIVVPGIKLMHAAAGAGLFILPLMLLQDALESTPPPATPDTGKMVGAFIFTMAGVWSMALEHLTTTWPLGTVWGLAALSAVALWLGLSSSLSPQSGNPFASVRKMPWTALGVVLGFAAFRTYQGEDLAGGYTLGHFTLALFLLGLVVPDLMIRLYRHAEVSQEAVPLEVVALYTVGLLGTGLVLVGLMSGQEGLIRGGGVVWLGCLLVLGRHFVLRKPPGASQTPLV